MAEKSKPVTAIGIAVIVGGLVLVGWVITTGLVEKRVDRLWQAILGLVMVILGIQVLLKGRL